MPKVDFTKVENALQEGLLKMSVEQLLYLADLVNVSFDKPFEDDLESRKASSTQTAQALTHALKNLEADLKKLRKKDIGMYEKLGVDKKELKQYFEHPQTLTTKDWEKIKNIRQKVESYKKELRKTLPTPKDEEIISSERKKHNYKRFNINDDWIPLK